MSRPARIELHIERLILDGIELDDRQAPLLVEAVTGELERRLARDGLAPHLLAGGAFAQLPATVVDLPEDRQPQPLGQRVGAAVSGAIGDRSRPTRLATTGAHPSRGSSPSERRSTDD